MKKILPILLLFTFFTYSQNPVAYTTTYVCIGQTVTINATPPNPGWYWFTNNGVIVTSTDFYQSSYTFTVTGNSYITFQNSSGTNPFWDIIAVSPIGNIGTISGLSNVCQGQSNINYTIPPISNASSYTWSLPNGATGTSTTNSININYLSNSVNGNITVQANNTCGSSNVATLPITVNSIPSGTGQIAGNSVVCQGQNNVTYSVPMYTNATSYTWTLPNGVTGSSNTNSITTNYSTTAVNGNISVTANNNCGSSNTLILPITVNLLPDTPTTILGSTNVCRLSQQTYSVTPIANATSYIWSFPSIGNQSTPTNTITVYFSDNANSGNITVQGINPCGNGIISTLPININPKPIITNVSNILYSNIVNGNQWYNSNGLINGATGQNYQPTIAGTYYVVANGCNSNLFNFGTTCINSMSGGNTFVNAIKSDNTLWTWGNGQTSPLKIGNNSDWTNVSSGINHSLAIKLNGTIWAWGNNTYGQLGNGTTTNSVNPIQIGIDTDWLSIFAVNNRSYAIKTDGTLWAWGGNSSASSPVFGLLGDGTTTNQYNPIQIGNSNNWKFISGNNIQTMALKTDGTIWGWGKAILGDGSTGLTPAIETPIQIGINNDWKEIATMFNNTIAIKTDGSLWGWGSNTNHQLASVNHLGAYYTPEQISLDYDWDKISGGYAHAVAIKTDGSLWSWGFNDNGQIGDGTTNDRHLPYHIGNSTSWSSTTCTFFSTLALNSSGIHWGWGQNTNGQIGNNSILNSLFPLEGNSCSSTLSTEGFNESSKISIFPNPFDSEIAIMTNDNINQIEIFDLLGKSVYFKKNPSEIVNIEFLTKGLYILKVNTAYENKNFKIIKK